MVNENVIFPKDFEYIEVVRTGKPVHEQYDSFWIKHPPMDLSRRAKIFSPFDALRGFNEAVSAKEVLYVPKKELNEEEMRELDQTLSILQQLTANGKLARENNIQATITYFVPCLDADNEAYMVKGQYCSITGTVMKVDSLFNKMITIDDVSIPICDVVKIECGDIDCE